MPKSRYLSGIAGLSRALMALSLVLGTPAKSQSLSVSPTTLNIRSTNQAVITVKAGGREMSVLQIRVMKWQEGTDPNRLKQTRDVVVTPPVAKLRPRQELTVRLMRTKKGAPRARECYRVLVDRLPGQEQKRQQVKLQVRHSIPVCFSS